MLRRLVADFGGVYAVNGLIAFIFAATGPVAIILAVGAQGGLTHADLSSWIFGSFFVNGLLSIGFCLAWRQPLVFFWTIPGAVLVGPALGHLSYPEVIGAFLATGVLMLALGLSGWVRRCTEAAPMPIVMAMVAGVFLRFGTGLVHAVRDDFAIAAPMVLVFVFLSYATRVARFLPPVLGALLTGVVATLWAGNAHLHGDQLLQLTLPTVYAPAFSWQAMVELVVPLAITVLVVQNGQGFAVLKAAGHKPPIDAIASACGASSMVTAFFGSVSSCLTGPVNAIISSSGEKERHYTAGVFVGVLALAFGALSPLFVRLLLSTPPAFIAVLGGLAMLRVLQTAFGVAFGGKFALGALVTFLVTVSDVTLFNVGAAFWALVIGFAVSWLLERGDFRR